MSLDPRAWRLKLEALLLPTPLVELDPAGEPAREAEVRRMFRIPASGDDAELLAGARRDAADAQAVGLSEGGGGLVPDRLLHPLDPESARPAPSRAEVESAWRRLLATAAGQSWDNAAALPLAYRRTWWAFAGEPDFQALPHAARLPDHSLFAHRSLAAAIVGARVSGGEAALLLAQTGPVQETIEASRRTSDLWMGSFLYSYLCYHALAALVEELGPDAVVSPLPRGLALAELGVFAGFGPPPALMTRVQPSLPAKVLAVVPWAGAQAVADRVSGAVGDAWARMAEAVRAWVQARATEAQCGPGWDEGFAGQVAGAVERGVVVLPWPREVERLRAFLTDVWAGPLVGTSGGALYGPMSGVVWRLSSSAGRASLPALHRGDARPKCTVCGVREQLGPTGEAAEGQAGDFWGRLAEGFTRVQGRESVQVKDGEGLCAVCLTRRFAPQVWFGGDASAARDRLLGLAWGEDEHRAYLRFPSVGSVASAPFRKAVLQAGRSPKVDKALRTLVPALSAVHGKGLLDFTPPGNLLPGLASFGRAAAGDPPARQLCDFDGAWMDADAYEPERAWRDHFGHAPPGKGDSNRARYEDLGPKLRSASAAYADLCAAVGATASAYFAALYLDGDQVSGWLNGSHPETPKLREVVPSAAVGAAPGVPDLDGPRPVFPALQSDISRRLSSLAAGRVAAIVHAHLGRLVYCGGDDVVALLPLITALPCAQAIYELLKSDEALGSRATASAGLVFAHGRDPLGPILRAARKAEKDAKDAGRDRLCVSVEPRSGEPLRVMLPWSFAPGQDGRTADALLELALAKDREDPSVPAVSLAFGYDLRAEAEVLSALPPEAMLVRLETALRRRLPTEMAEGAPRVLRLVRWMMSRGARPDLVGAVDTLLLARFLAREARGIDLHAVLGEVR